jgi:hypothetical protein
MMQQMASYASSNITTEVIQKYLDENKQLILAILDNQNQGRLNECAMYQAKLQQNLMYLAAIADAQPQGINPQQHAAAAPAPAIQPAQQYLQQQQQLFMTQRNSIPQYLQQSQQASQQSFYTQQALMSGGGSAGLHMLQSSADRGGMQLGADNGPQLSTGFSDGGSRDGNQSTQQLGLRGEIHHAGGGATGGPDLGVSSPLGHRDGGSVQGGDDSEASYLKGSDASSL